MAKTVQDDLFDQLEARFNTAKDQFQQIDTNADMRIKHWRYAKDSVFELRVEYYRRFNTKAGKLVEDELLHELIYTAYGFDDQDRIICSAVFQSEDNPRIYTYYDYADDHIGFAEFGIVWDTQTYQLSKVGRLVKSSDDRPLHYADYAQAAGQKQRFFEEYHYDETGRITRISAVHQYRPAQFTDEEQRWLEYAHHQQEQIARMFLSEEQASAVLEPFDESLKKLGSSNYDIVNEDIFEYEGQTLKRIVQRASHTLKDGSQPQEYILYEAPRPGETADMLFDAARISLKAAIIDRLKQLDAAVRQKGPFYNLIVSYDAVADDGLLLTLNIQRQRALWEKSTDESGYDSLALDSVRLPQDAVPHIGIWDLPEDYARFLRDSRRDDQWERIRQLVCAVAKELNDHDWRAMFPITEDFIVIASDYEALEDIRDEIRACVPEAKLAILRARGLID
jgi:hypothetical protein